MRHISIIGAGSVGGSIAWILTLMGRTIPFSIAVYDDDTIEPHNPTNQIYREQDVLPDAPKNKVAALKEILSGVSENHPTAVPIKVDRNTPLSGFVVSAVHSMTARAEIFRAVKGNATVPLYIDTRSGGNLALVYAFDPRDQDQIKQYELTLHKDDDAAPAPCANPETIPALYAIGAIVAKLLRLFQERPPKRFIKLLINFDGTPIVGEENP